jgi:hypothetical protein
MKVTDFHVAAGLLQKCSDFTWLAELIVCRKGNLDPKTPANRHTGCPGKAMPFLAAGHNIRTCFLRNAEIIQNNSDEIWRKLIVFR